MLIVPLTVGSLILTIVVELPDVALPAPSVTYPVAICAFTVTRTSQVSLLDMLPFTAYISVRPACSAVKFPAVSFNALIVPMYVLLLYHVTVTSIVQSLALLPAAVNVLLSLMFMVT